MKEEFKCPACYNTSVENVLLDVNICNRCMHLFTPQKVIHNETVDNTKTNIMRANRLGKYGMKKKVLIIGPIDENLFQEVEILTRHRIDNAPYNFELNDSFATYDIIAFFNCLEFVNNPTERLEFIKKYLNKDGLIMFEIPTMLFSQIEVGPTDFYSGKQCQYFTQDSILEMLKKAGLKIIEQENYWNCKIANSFVVCCKDVEFNNIIKKSHTMRYGGTW